MSPRCSAPRAAGQVVFTSSGTEASNRRSGAAGAGRCTHAHRGDGGRALGRARRVSPQRCRGDRRRSRSLRPLRPRRRARRGPARDRARHRAAGQPRGRDDPTRGRGGGGVQGARDARPRRCVHGGRPRPGRLRQSRRRPLLGERAQVRWAEGSGCAARPPGAAVAAVRRRWRAGMRPAGRPRGRPGHGRLRRRRRRGVRRQQARRRSRRRSASSPTTSRTTRRPGSAG